jgi:transposase
MTDQRAAEKGHRRDPVVEEVRNIREKHARRFGYDPEAIYEDLKRYQEESEREVVSFPPKRLDRAEGPTQQFIEAAKGGGVSNEATGYRTCSVALKRRRARLRRRREAHRSQTLSAARYGGFPMGVHVTAASVGERAGAKQMLESVKDELPRLRKIWVDGGFDGAPFAEWAEQVGNWTIEVVHKIGKGFTVLPRRWVVERTFTWLYKVRRLSRDFERLGETVESFIYITMIRLIVNRLAPA